MVVVGMISTGKPVKTDINWSCIVVPMSTEHGRAQASGTANSSECLQPNEPSKCVSVSREEFSFQQVPIEAKRSLNVAFISEAKQRRLIYNNGDPKNTTC